MRRAILQLALGVTAIALALFGSYAFAADYTRGEVLAHGLSVCMKKADAVELVNTEVEKGQEAAGALFEAKAECANIPIMGLIVGKTVHSAKVKRGGEATMSVVEMLNDEGKVVAYFITTGTIAEPVKGINGEALKLKPERNA